MAKKVNIGAIIGIAIGAVIIILAVVMLGEANRQVTMNILPSSTLSTSSQFQLSYSFGADFYTEMFGVTYKTLQQLIGMSSDNAKNIAAATNTIVSGMQGGMSHISKQVSSLLAYVILAIGLATVGLSFGKLFVWVPAGKDPAFAPVPDYSFSRTQNTGTAAKQAEPETVIPGSSPAEPEKETPETGDAGPEEEIPENPQEENE